MTEVEFTQFATAIVNAANKMIEYKDLSDIEKDLDI